MAASPSHELGEKIGVFFEDVMKPSIKEVCNNYNMYFDTIGPRKARSSKKITWTDVNGNKHDLDYVIEKGGTEEKIGEPIGFIELAWRRYTKHSKNKVQEIAGAILPIAEKYKKSAPFKGAILSGDFTETSLNQLKNEGFKVLYIPFAEVISSFKKHGIDISYDEDTPEAELAKKVQAVDNCSKEKFDKIRKDFIDSNSKLIQTFKESLEDFLGRVVDTVYILPLHGKAEIFEKTEDAIDFINQYQELPNDCLKTVKLYHVKITYSDGSEVNCTFKNKKFALDFLQKNA